MYFFLAGVAVCTARLLWVLPLATAASATLCALSSPLLGALLPGYR